MSKLSFKNEGEGHSFWQNYTDLMSGLMVVFLIAAAASLFLYNKAMEDLNDVDSRADRAEEELNDIKSVISDIVGWGPGIGESLDSALTKLVRNAKLYEQVKAFDEAQAKLTRNYFNYDTIHHRFICKIDVQFAQDSHVIAPGYKTDLVAAGKELESILSSYHQSEYIGFKVVIDGRAARHYEGEPSNESVDRLSYLRARELYNLWRQNGIINRIELDGGDISVSGSGFYGSGRYPFAQEMLNKQFIIQIIPYIKF